MMEELMIRFGREPAIDRFAFTGGEAFLYLDDIKAAVSAARKAGVTQPFQIVTSAYWATGPGQVRAILGELRGLGMDLIGLSYDHEHAKWVTPEQITIVCDVAAELGMKINLWGTFWEVGDRVEDLLPEVTARSEVNAQNFRVAEMGRAKTSRSWPRRYDVPIDEKFTCGRPGNYSLAIYPDGEVYPCCSGGIQIEGKLSCGNVNRDPPSRIIYAALTNFHVRMVKEFGWGILYELVEREAPELVSRLPKFEEADGVCAICRDLNLTVKDALAPIYHKVEVEYARARARFEWLDREKADGRGGYRRVGEDIFSSEEFLDRVVADRGLRLDYLAGLVQIGRCVDDEKVLERVDG
jgi:hypothetical protein